MSGEMIKIEGLNELRSALGRLDRKLPGVVDRGCKDAAELVVKDVKRRIPIGPAKGGHARASVRSARVSGGYEVRAGGVRYPYYMWLEFGGHVGRRHHTYRLRVPEGRYISPSVIAQQDRIKRAMRSVLARAVRSSGLRFHEGA